MILSQDFPQPSCPKKTNCPQRCFGRPYLGVINNSNRSMIIPSIERLYREKSGIIRPREKKLLHQGVYFVGGDSKEKIREDIGFRVRKVTTKSNVPTTSSPSPS